MCVCVCVEGRVRIHGPFAVSELFPSVLILACVSPLFALNVLYYVCCVYVCILFCVYVCVGDSPSPDRDPTLEIKGRTVMRHGGHEVAIHTGTLLCEWIADALHLLPVQGHFKVCFLPSVCL